ncbi:methylated-DNA--[protein]-cysteine S-methyltransferase [Chitinibacteraceae bacterium HSL-7]
MTHYELVAELIRYLRAHAHEQPELAALAARFGWSESHLQRVFSEWAGVSPKRFLQFLTRQHARQILSQTDVVSAAAELGLSAPSRLYDLIVTSDAMTPGEAKRGGSGITLRYAEAETLFGPAFIAQTTRGICALTFGQTLATNLATLQSDWPHATLVSDPSAAEPLATLGQPAAGPLHLWLRGSNFQLKVWEALLRIPPGHVMSYGQLATAAGVPGAQRAVGTALARNRIALLIPCHRVIRENGDFGQYAWGEERKAALLGWEQAGLERAA